MIIGVDRALLHVSIPTNFRRLKRLKGARALNCKFPPSSRQRCQTVLNSSLSQWTYFRHYVSYRIINSWSLLVWAVSIEATNRLSIQRVSLHWIYLTLSPVRFHDIRPLPNTHLVSSSDHRHPHSYAISILRAPHQYSHPTHSVLYSRPPAVSFQYRYRHRVPSHLFLTPPTPTLRRGLLSVTIQLRRVSCPSSRHPVITKATPLDSSMDELLFLGQSLMQAARHIEPCFSAGTRLLIRCRCIEISATCGRR